MAAFKTLQFLPEIFRTDTNRKFLNATADQLTSEPDLVKVNGYIGRKLAPSFKPNDSYITEPTRDRQNYQLEPSIVIKDPVTGNLEFATTYADIINKINFYSGLSSNHSRLFDNEYYSYNPQIDFDKFVNFALYYWLENGPDAVAVTASTVPFQQTFDVTYDSVTKTYRFTGFNDTPNPIITLARGGNYTFRINEPGNKFFIQSGPGSLGVDQNATNLSTRNVFGVANNGQDVGSVSFQVPLANSQVRWTSMPIADSVDFATSYSFQTLQGCLVSDLLGVLGGLDGPSSSLNEISLIFINNEFIDDIYWHDTARVSDNVIYLDQNRLVPLSDRNNVYQIAVYNDQDDKPRVYLSPKTLVSNEQKVRVISGATNAGKEFYSRLDIFNEVPAVTAPQTLLYYQSDQSDSAVGGIQLIDPIAAEIDPDVEIIGQANYISPNGVVFTNGLKVTFDSTATDAYANKTYYVEGVGQSIRLVLIDDLVSPELDSLSTQDYLTINRASIDLNGWSRSNRWFHVDVIEKTAQYNKIDLVLNQNFRAQRPIIEFNADLQLFNFGTEAKLPIDILDDIITDAYVQIQGVLCVDPNELTVTLNGRSVTFTNGDRVIFSQDENLDVRNKVYDFSIVVASLPTEATPVYRAYIVESTDTLVEQGHTIVVNKGDNGGKQWHYSGSEWILSQQKTSVNQAPLFDVIDKNGVSFSDFSFYPGSQFAGTKIFSYKQGTGSNDNILGFPLSYKNFLTQGDIQFENNFSNDQFSYLLVGGTSKTVKVGSGLLQKNLSRDTSIRLNDWTINLNFSKQYQIFNYTYDGTTNLFPIDILSDISVDIPNIKVAINNKNVPPGKFAITRTVDKLAILIDPSLLKLNDVVFVSLYSSKSVSNTGFYQIPVNLDINSLNVDLDLLTLGQLRNHLTELKNNSLDIIGEVPGNSNIRDIFINNRGGSILQHSAPVVYAGLFLNNPTMNLIDSLQLAAREYNQFKIKFLELAANLELDKNNIAQSVDTIISVINGVKNENFPWYYSDMVPYGNSNKTVLPSYTIFDTDIRAYEITNIFQDTVINNKAVLVYITRTIDGITSTTLLLKDQDYYFNQTNPAVILKDSFNLLYNDILTIVEYSNTDGSYIPETPTKMGLYPKFTPEIYLDNTYQTPTLVIQGHDGSLTPAFGDIRDQLLLELERRIYNNIKVEYNVNNFNINDVFPGKFRILDYSRQEFNQLLSQSFLRWVGTNRVDYTTNNFFTASNPFTWNYKNFKDVINAENLPGAWRSVFKYFYDTNRPHTHPWEMLGFSEKPDWWNDRYGPAPYTGGNFVLWSDLESGYVHAGPRAGVDLRYSRPGLTSIIPVDDNGNLRAPSEFLVTDFDSSRANASYEIGDMGPTETSWRRSSDYPFAIQRALAIAKPARYFSLLVDIQKYLRNDILGQFLDTESNRHLQPSSIRVNGFINPDGSVERSAGYLNWIRDYIKNTGVSDASAVIKDSLSKISVKLTYKMAGYSDKRFLELLAEQISPSSVNDSIVIPDENYTISLYKGSPITKIVYSAVIIEKTVNGYTVSGYNTNDPFFKVIPSLPNNNSYVITTSGLRATIYKNSRNVLLTIPYGFEFNTKQQVVDFLVSYQRYLVAQGFVFLDRENILNENKDWILSAKEFLHWSSQGWNPGNLIVLSPISDTLKVVTELAVVDEITNIPTGSRILDINYSPIVKNNFTVLREENQFSIKALADQTIGFAELNLVQFEHLLLLDNLTVFNDVIYLPETGNRQFRIKLIGSKTNRWNGSLELPGYMYSSDIIAEWQPGVDYLKGSIIEYKQRLYTALENITAADKFQSNSWQLLDINEVKTGVINNLATNASQALRYYDINDQPIDEQAQLFSNGLIGFRPREYFTNLGVDVTTQSKFYQGVIKQGGTLNAINALRGAQFNNLGTQPIDIFENWAVRVGEYGATDINQQVEFILADSDFDNNPAVFQLVEEASTVQPDIKSFAFDDIYKGDINNVNFLRIESRDQPPELKPLPVAGFVNLDDVDATIFNILESTADNFIQDMGVGYTIWTAKDLDNHWNVFRSTRVPGTPFILRYNIDSQAELVNSEEHGLAVNDLVALKNFDDRYNGIYKVDGIIDGTRFLITIRNNLQDLIDDEAVIGNGILYKLKSSLLETATDIVTDIPFGGYITDDKIWVKNLDNQGNWAVYNKSDPWKFESRIQLGESQYAGNDNFGKSVVLDNQALFLYGGAPNSGAGRVSAFARNIFNNWDSYGFVSGVNPTLRSFGKVLATATVNGQSYLAVGAPESTSGGVVYIFENQQLIQILSNDTPGATDKYGASLAMSDDAKYLYVSAPGADKVFAYCLDYPRQQSVQLIVMSGTTDYTLSSFAASPGDLIVAVNSSSSQYFPYIDYTLASAAAGISSFSFVGNAAPGVDTFYGITATGGTGSGATFFVKKDSTYTVLVENGGSGYAAGQTLTILGTDVGGISPDNDITVTIGTTDTVTNLVFGSPPTAGLEINIIRRTNRYTNIASLTGTVGENYGSAVTCSTDGTTFAIGANNATVNGLTASGNIQSWHVCVVEIVTNGITNTFTLPYNLGPVYRVYLNDELIYNINNAPPGVTALYTVIGSNQIQYGDSGIDTLPPGNRFRFETNQVLLDQTIEPELVGVEGGSFGSLLAMCNSGCNIYVSSPTYKESNYTTGLVSRYLNIGRIYGVVLGTVANPTVTQGDRLVINNVVITFSGSTLNTVLSDILGANIPGVTASIEDNKLKIISDVVVAQNKLNIVNGNNNGTALRDLGIFQYQYVQTIRHPENFGEIFGISLTVDQTTNTLAIGSDGADSKIVTTFDQSLGRLTMFDSGGTAFVQLVRDSGAVYIYNLMANPFESEQNPRLFAYSQKLNGPELDSGFNFGAGIAIRGEYLTVGVSNDYNIVSGGGSIYTYYNQNAKSGWTLIRSKEPRVDIGAVNSSFIYNTRTQNIIEFFDYIDPAKGKLLGVVDQELDFKDEYDPASYNNSTRTDTINNSSFYWSDQQVGQIWLDTSRLSFIDYEQGSIQYRVKNWGDLFPGSQVQIYEWVESDFLPSLYANSGADGVARYTDDSAYSSVTVVDPVTGIITQKYYYWVSGKTTVDINRSRRTISASRLESYITNPKDQGIPYLALLKPNAVAVYNVTNKLTANDVAIHFDTSTTRNANLLHNEWQLVKQGADRASIPTRVISKLKDSLSGVDSNDFAVPDPMLLAQDKLGILNLPRQTILLNRSVGLENYVITLNSILLNYPILLIRTPSFLYLDEPLPTVGFDSQTSSVADLAYLNTDAFDNEHKVLVNSDSTYQGRWSIYNYNSATKTFEVFKLQSIKTSLYWTPKDWYSIAFVPGKEVNYIVNIYSEIQALPVVEGNYVKVLDGGQGTWLLYEVLADGSLDLIGAQSGTIEIDSSVYDTAVGSGYDTVVYDSVIYDSQPVKEFRNIYDSVSEEILIENLGVEFNRLFLTMVNYVFSEQKNPDWIFKTSFVDVLHSLRSLDELPNYVRDNQDFYNDYINEVKPYRTVVREYVPLYSKQDFVYGNLSDFDLPSAYNSQSRVFSSPNIHDPADAELFSTDLYSPWAASYKFKITDYIIGNIGSNYSLPPNVEITGGGGSGAAAITTLFGNGKVSGITVINPGSGYTTTPNVFINGDGVGATAYPLMKNEFYAAQANLSYNLVRSIDTVIKFDRLSYASNLVTWRPNTAYANTIVVSGNTVVDASNIYIASGNIVVYNNQAFLATNANVTSQQIFDFTRFTKLDSGNVLLSAVDRIAAYYQPTVGMPGKNLSRLVEGVGYPGNYIESPAFRANSFEVTSNVISFDYNGLTINSNDITKFDFVNLGFEVDQGIRVEADVPFEFQNNGYFTIVNVNRDSMTLTGQPVESTWKILLDNPVTANAGDWITQANNTANAYILESVVNSQYLSVIYTTPEFTVSAGNGIAINGITVTSNIAEINTGGNIAVTISYLDLKDLLDSNIYSTYLDSNLGIRPQDINIVGGAYVDTYSSHAPEELVPGRLYDALDLQVFTKTVGNTATYGFRAFQPMSANILYTRISANATTTLAENLNLTDSEILVTDSSVLPEPSPALGIPGIVYINGERIHYYQRYDANKMSTAIAWSANTSIPDNTLIEVDGNVYLTQGNVYANTSAYINTANIQLIRLNSLRQIRRGADGTGPANVILAGNLVSDTSLAQMIPNAQIFSPSTVSGNITVTSNVTFKLILSSTITANIGDYITQFANTGNARVLQNVTNTNVIPVDFVTGTYQLASNIGTRINLVSLTTGITNINANVVSLSTIGSVYSNGNVVLSSVPLLRSNIWEEFGTTLQNSTTIGAQFIKAEPSYTP